MRERAICRLLVTAGASLLSRDMEGRTARCYKAIIFVANIVNLRSKTLALAHHPGRLPRSTELRQSWWNISQLR